MIGYYRILSQPYLHTVLDTILTAAVADDMPLEAIVLDDCLTSLAGYGIPENVIQHCLSTFADDVTNAGESIKTDHGAACIKPRCTRQGVYRLSERKICEFIGVELLRKEMVGWIALAYCSWVTTIETCLWFL